MYLIINSKD